MPPDSTNPGPTIGAVYESTRPNASWRWEVIADHADGEMWELARIGGNRTRRGNLLRTTAELRDEKKWRLVEMATPSSPSSQTELLPLPEGIRGR